MTQMVDVIETDRYSKSVEASKRVRWDIDKDVIRGMEFDFTKKFLPDGLSMVERLDFLAVEEKRLISQIQGRTYGNVFGLVERFIGVKVLEISRTHWLGNQIALEALVRFGDEELKHQELFRRIERMIGEKMPEGYQFPHDPNAVASVVLGKSTWAVLGLTCMIELFTQSHYKLSIEPEEKISELFKNVFRYHWLEESQHATLDELEWTREDAMLTPSERDRAVTDLIELAGAVDGIIQTQAESDARYFLRICERPFNPNEAARVQDVTLEAYRWQYIKSGVEHPRFMRLLGGMIDAAQGRRINDALAPIL
jgi:hypothetical protein